MQQQCENLEKCGFFIGFKGNAEVIKQGWIKLFCESIEKSEKCRRKQIKKETGKPPVDNLSPTGKLIKIN